MREERERNVPQNETNFVMSESLAEEHRDFNLNSTA